MPARDAIAALIPHQGTMCLNERIVAWDARRVVLATASHRAADNPLRTGGRLRALHLAEYGAQAMAVHGGLSGDAARAGMLVAIRDLKLHVERLDDIPDDLRVEARRLVANPGGLIYSFAVRAGERELATGRVSVIFAR